MAAYEEDIYDDVAPTPHNGHVQSYTPPTMPQSRSRPEPMSRTLPSGRGAPVIPTRAPTTSLSQTLQQKPPAQKDKKKGKPSKQAPPPPVNTSGGLDMNEILRKRQKLNANKFEDLEKSKKDDEEEKLAPWQLEKKRVSSNRSSIVLKESKNKDTENDEPEFLKKRRSMSLRDSEDETPISPPPVASKPSAPIVPIKEERSPSLKHQPPVVTPKPKPAPRPKPGTTNSPPLAPKPKPAPPSRKDSLPNTGGNPPSPSTRPAFEKNVKPAVPIPPKPGSSPHTERRSNNPPLTEEELPPPPFKPPPPSDSPPTAKARPPIAARSPSRVNPNTPGEPPLLAQHQKKSSPVLPPKPLEGLPPKPPQALPPKPSENATPTFKPPAPLPPVQSIAEPTPVVPSLLRYRRLPLPPVDINNPPPLPSRALKPSTGFTTKRAPLIPTESQDIDEDIYDDTIAVTGDNGGDDIYDDTMPVTSEVEPMNEDDEEIYDDVAAGGPPPSLPSRPPKLPPIPSIATSPPPISSAPPTRSPPPTLPVPPIPLEEEQEDYEEPSKLQNPGASPNTHHDHGSLPPVPPSPRSTLPLPPTQQTGTSPIASPTLQRKTLTKEEKKQLKEEEKRAREQKRLDQLKEREMKKREEQKTKNRQKSMKAFKDYKLPDYIQPLFSVEILSNKKPSKNHMSVVAGERMSVLLIAHDCLPHGKYLVEKEDGTVGLVDEIITERTVYQSAQQLGIQQSSDNFGYGIDEDIYEALEPEVDDGKAPALPPMNTQTIPQEEEDPQDVYEFLPDN